MHAAIIRCGELLNEIFFPHPFGQDGVHGFLGGLRSAVAIYTERLSDGGVGMASPAKSVPIHDFRLLFESAPGLYLVLNPQLQIVAVSDAYLNATMTTRQDIVGRGIFEVFPDNPDDPGATGVRNLKASLARVLRERVSDIMHLQKYDVRRPDSSEFEERYWSPVNSPVLASDGGLLYVIHRVEDVTDFVRLRQSEFERSKLTDDLRAKSEKMEAEVYLRARQLEEVNRNRLEAVGRVAAGIAHDFNNLLGVVLGNAQLVLEKIAAESPLAQGLDHIMLAAQRGADLTRQLLAYSRQQVLEPRVLNVNDVVAGLEPMMGRLIRENVEVRVVAASNLDSVNADPGQLEQVIMNLVLNARDAMPNGGRLLIETSNVVIDEEYQEQHPNVAVTTGPYVMLSISDSGTGIDPETQVHIFEPFFTTKPKGLGTGLGLSTVYGIVKQSGGYVWVYSERGKGTSFKVYLPRTGEAPQIALAAESRPQILTGSETVLVVEDQPMLRELIGRMLSSNGYTVLSADTPTMGLQIAQTHAGPIHVALTDVIMPGMNGRAMIEQLLRVQPHTRIVFMSAYTEDIIDHHHELMEGAGFINKPFTRQALCAEIREILDRM